MASSYSTLSTKGSERLTSEQIRRKRALADAMMSRQFSATPVAPGGQYSAFAGIADAIRSVTGNLQGSRDNKALDAREAELAAAEQAKQATHASLFDAMQSQPTLAEPEMPLGRGPAPLPEELAAPEPVTQPVTSAPGPDAIAPLPVAPTANPMHQQLAGALMSAVPELAGAGLGPQSQAPQAYPLSDTPSQQGEGFQAVAEAMRGVPAPGTIPPIVQDSPPGFSQSQQDQIGDIEAASMLGDNPDYPPEIVPPGPPIEIGANGVGTMPPMTVTGRKEQGPQPALLEAMKAQQPHAPTGPAVAPELVQAMMEKTGLAMPAPIAQAPGARQATPAQPQAQADDRWIRLWKSSVAVGDQAGMKFALERMAPEEKEHVIGDTLVRGGKPIYQGPGKAPAPLDVERILAARGILPGTPEHDAALASAQDKITSHGAGVKIENYGGPTQGVDARGNPVFFQTGSKGGAPNIIEGVAPTPKDKPEKVLPTKAMTNIEGAASAAEDTERFVNTFKPEYGGHFILGKLSNTIGRTVGDDTGQAQWWQDLEAHQNVTRHELFGSALTKTELGAWNATAVNPSMNAGEIKKNLERRMAIERRAVSKLAKSYMAQGYNKEGIRELLGPMADYILDTPTSTVSNTTTKGRGSMGTASGFAPPKDAPAGTKFYGYSPDGQRVWKLPDGSMATE